MSTRLDSLISYRRSSAKLVLVSLTVTFVIALVTLTARAWLTKTGSTQQQDSAAAQPTPATNVSGYIQRASLPAARARLFKTKTTQQSASAAATPGRVKIGAELITITPQGFMPTNITRPKDPFFLVVDNRSELSEVSFQLRSETGQRLKEVLVKHEELDWVDAVDLQPGRYVLTEAKHPAWICRITITAK